MNSVIAFPRDRAEASPREVNGPARVLIFTGVRYERLESPPLRQPDAVAPAPRTGRPGRG
jgi:hypothetical protein